MICPQCSQQIEQDFGVITCQNCGAVLMVDIDGNVQVSGAAPSVSDAIANQSSEEFQEIIPTPQQANFSEVIEFANTNLASGPLSYNLVIEGIDNAILKEKVREALQDQKLKLNVDEILGTIKNGRIEIANLNPTKTSLIVQRLGEEKLQIHWSQHVY